MNSLLKLGNSGSKKLILLVVHNRLGSGGYAALHNLLHNVLEFLAREGRLERLAELFLDLLESLQNDRVVTR
jgi:hypothetical protein